MPILRIKDVNNMSSEDRNKKLAELRAELSRLRTMVSAGGSIENPTRIREIRRAIAQVLTVENEQKLGIRKKEKEVETKETKKPMKTKEKKTK
jgi:large subunit ribosomal protein L29